MTTKQKDAPPSTHDSGYISQPLDSSSSFDLSSSIHQKTNSTTSSGYYSRLDSSDFPLIPEEDAPKESPLPWQYYVTPTTNTSLTPLHSLVIAGDISTLSKVIGMLPHSSVLNVLTAEGQTALHLGVLTNQKEVVRMLVINGANVNAKDRNGDGPVHLACRWGFGDCLENIVRAVGVDEGGVGVVGGCDLEGCNYEGLTPLHLATLSYNSTPNHPLPLLLYLSVPTTCQEGRAGRTPLHLAVEKRDISALKLLLEYSNKSTLEICNYSQMTVYTLASCNLLKEFCHVLRERGADVVDYFSSEDEEEE